MPQERTKDWQNRFGSHLGMVCKELTGDSSMAEAHEIDDADVICTTPEKFGEHILSLLLYMLNAACS